MLRWIRHWRERRALRGRALFSYHDGARARRADPAVLWRKLLNHPKMDFATMVPLADQGQEPETTIVLGALCEIFDVQPWDERTGIGLTNWEILDLVRQFDDYLDALKKSISPSRMPLQLMGYGSSSSPEPPPPPTSSPADCCSTPGESNCGGATCSCAPSPTA